jgi:Protein of unknown function (DUF3632).
MVHFFEIAGHVVFGFVGKIDLSLLENLKLSGCNLWQGDSSLSMERWEFWKKRLQWASGQDELMERTRADARKLVHLCKKLSNKPRLNSGIHA